MHRFDLAAVRLASIGALALAALFAAVACSDTSGTQPPGGAGSVEPNGELGLALQLASGDTLASVSYAIIGANGFSKTGSIDVSTSVALGATIPLPAGAGYTITLSAASTNGHAQCSGSASFDITAHRTTPVLVPVLCHEGPRTGSVTVNGTSNVCPTVDGINAAPAEVVVGSSVALNVLAHDSDAGPAPLSYAWTVSGGSLSDAHSPTPTFTCSAAGTVTLTVSVSDGDPAPSCADSGSVSLTCSSRTGAGTGGAPGAGGASAGGAGASAGGGASGAGGNGPALNVVVYRVGDGAGSLVNTGNPVFIDEYSNAGALVRSTGMPASPAAGNHRLVASGTATSEGFITRSSNGKYVLLTGYDSALPASASLTASASSAVPRTIGRLDASGILDTSTGLVDAATGSNPRSVASSDGTSLWVTGAAGGIRFATLGGSASLQLSTTVTNLRQVALFGAQLYVSDSSGSAVRLGSVGLGLPTTAGQTISNLPGIPAGTGSPYGFFLADLDPSIPGMDVLYVADDGAGIIKYSLLNGAWTTSSTLGSAADAYRGLTGSVFGTSVVLYSTRKGGSTATGGGELVQILDASGFNGALTGTPILLASAPPNSAFRGVALAPQP